MNPVLSTLDLLFGLRRPVSRAQYVTVGLSLALFKYAVEAAAVYYVVGAFYTPLQFLSPVFTHRAADFHQHPWLGWVLFFGSLPFLWIALSMSVRRAIDSHAITPWMSLLVLLPLVNLAIMFLLATAPTGKSRFKAPAEPGQPSEDSQALQVFHAIFGGLVIGTIMLLVSVTALGNYGTGLFIGTPVLMGTAGSYLYNRKQRMTVGASVWIGFAIVACGTMGLLLFAVEGVVCVVMAAPLIFPLGIFGALLGYVIAEATRDENQVPHVSAIVICLPLLAGLENYLAQPSEAVVMTAVEIDAPPEVVWEKVISFPEIDSPAPWYFRLGIAMPMRAHIVGHGVGAVRHCEFTTGTFVEPITAWDAPHRLAFDVTEQPDPLVELSPYRNVHPPHLDGYMRSNRGEFRLIALEDGRTRLEGRTWYELHMFPQRYWMLWSDLIIHQIHERVLEHIQREAEKR